MKNVNEIENDLNNIIERVEQIKRDLELITKPEFKVGQWVRTSLGNSIRRIFAIRDGFVYLDYMDGEDQYSKSPFLLSIIKGLATPIEIESHLSQICDKKYIGKTVRCLRADRFKHDPKLQIQKPVRYGNYNSVDDYLYYMDAADKAIWLYEKGKFAEIIPEKKKLPKTRAEYRKFLDDFWHALPEDDDMPGLISDDFLNEYEL